MKRRTLVALVTLGLTLAVGAPLRADDGNYQNYVLGERAGSMGGAGTAGSVGAEACFYNPAGLALAPASSISLSAALYGYHRRTTEDGWFPGEDIEIDSFTFIPSMFSAVLKPSADVALAFSLLIPDKQLTSDFDTFRNAPGTADDDHFFRYTIDDVTLWAGPTAALRLSPRWSVGASVFAVYRTFTRSYDYFLTDYGLTYNQDLRYSVLSLLGELGVRFDRDERWSFGLMLQTPSLHLADSAEAFQRAEYPGGLEVYYYPDGGEARNRTPTALRAGAAWRDPGRLGAALDLTYHFPVTYDRISGVDNWGNPSALSVKREGVLDFNVGGEWYFAPGYPLRAGVFSSYSSAPATSLDSPYEETHMDKYGVTLGVARETEHATIGLGVSYVRGSGRGIGLVEGPDGTIDTALVDERDSYLLVNVSSSYSF